MEAESIFESVPNFSEGRRPDVIDALAAAAAPAHLLDVSADVDHNRAVVSLAAFKTRLVAGLVGAVGEARDRIDIRSHQGVHPRVGAADVVPIVPLGGATLAEAHDIARELGERIWTELRIPVYFYGYAEAHTLADIRAGRAALDLGGPSLHPTAGAVCVGARPILVAFNVVVRGADAAALRELARSLRESSGGRRGIQALGLSISGGRLQLSMNLFRLDEARPGDVVAELERRGVAVESQEVVGLCPAVAANTAANGRLLEGRLASAAARTAAERCRTRGGEEMTALASRLDREARELAVLGVSQEAILGGGERAAALIHVLRAAHVLDPELQSMLNVAARGLRAALSSETVAVHRVRVDALDARLS